MNKSYANIFKRSCKSWNTKTQHKSSRTERRCRFLWLLARYGLQTYLAGYGNICYRGRSHKNTLMPLAFF